MKKKKLLKGSGANLMMSIFDVGMFTIKHCKKNPEIMFAIIMTESGGDEKAQSYCARGLTQMTKVALEDVRRISKQEWYFDDLFDPLIALKSAEVYFEYLLQSFKGHKLFAVLAYSWGIGNTYRWIRSEPDNSKIDEMIPPTKRLYLQFFILGILFHAKNSSKVAKIGKV